MENSFIESECVLELAQKTIGSLINEEDDHNEIDLLKEFFNERYQNLILVIPLSRTREDKLI